MVNQPERRKFLLTAGILTGCFMTAPETCASMRVISGHTMGTRYRILIGDATFDISADQVRSSIQQVFEATESTMSGYRANSDLSRFNRILSDDWQAISPRALAVVESALEIQRLSQGAFNPAVAPLVSLWGFGAQGGNHSAELSQSMLNASMQTTSLAGLETDMARARIRKQLPQARIDLDGIAKGGAIDDVALMLNASGINDFLIEVGGEVRVSSEDSESGDWRVGIENPDGSLLETIKLTNQSIATSGDYVNYFRSGGARYSHLIDPATGRPVQHGLALVSVVANTALEADAWSTALSIMGLATARPFAESRGMPVLFLQRDGDTYKRTMTPEFERLLVSEAAV